LAHHLIFGLFLRWLDIFLNWWLLHFFRDKVQGDTLFTLQPVLLKDLLKFLIVLEASSYHLLDFLSLILIILDTFPALLDRRHYLSLRERPLLPDVAG
jgi:hypothetical protein